MSILKPRSRAQFLSDAQLFNISRAIFFQALETFLYREATSIAFDVSERNLCSRLAIYIEQAASVHDLGRYYADVEYNRQQGGAIKTTRNLGHSNPRKDDHTVLEITCDLILHSRGFERERDNLLAIEMKKNTTKSEADQKAIRDDKLRLCALTTSPKDRSRSIYDSGNLTATQIKKGLNSVCGYSLGVFIDINSHTRCCTIDEFRGGSEIPSSHATRPIYVDQSELDELSIARQ